LAIGNASRAIAGSEHGVFERRAACEIKTGDEDPLGIVDCIDGRDAEAVHGNAIRARRAIQGSNSFLTDVVSRALVIAAQYPRSRLASLADRSLEQHAVELTARPFNLARGPLLRARLVKLAEDDHVLMVVVQVGSMNKAAALLNTRQSAISRSIAELERAIGVQLLDRNPQGVEPTEYGRALLDGGAAMFDELRQAVKKIEFLADPTAGEVRIGCTFSLATSFVFAAVDRLSLRYPRTVLHVVPTQTDALHPGLSERNFDLAITQRFGPFADDRLGFETLYDDTFVVLAGAQNSWVRRRNIDLADLVNDRGCCHHRKARLRRFIWKPSVPQRYQAGRSAGHAVDEVRIRHQSTDRQGARPRCAADTPRPRRRGD